MENNKCETGLIGASREKTWEEMDDPQRIQKLIMVCEALHQRVDYLQREVSQNHSTLRDHIHGPDGKLYVRPMFSY